MKKKKKECIPPSSFHPWETMEPSLSWLFNKHHLMLEQEFSTGGDTAPMGLKMGSSGVERICSLGTEHRYT